jgi:hypothetical protein
MPKVPACDRRGGQIQIAERVMPPRHQPFTFVQIDIAPIACPSCGSKARLLSRSPLGMSAFGGKADIAVTCDQCGARCPGFAEGAVSYQPEAGSMHVLRILLLVMTAGVLAFILYQAITRQIPRDAFWTVIAIACGFSLNLIYLWFAKPGELPVAIEDKPPVAVEEKAPVVDKANDAGPQPDEVSGKRGLTPNCEKVRRTADLLRFFANRIQKGEETQSVVADVTQQEKRITAVCPD